MPRSPTSLRLTDSYRRRLFSLRDELQKSARDLWDQPERLAAMVETAQKAALRLTGAYLTAFLASEKGQATRAVAIDSGAYSGSTADGKPLADGMRSPLIGYFGALKRGKSVEEARRIGINRAVRQVGMNYDASHRTALSETLKSDDRFDGGLRAVRGTCGACAAFSGTPHMEVHANCQCVEEPKVSGVSQLITRPTGMELFNAKTPEEQDAMVGIEAADKLRKGEIAMGDLVAHSELDSDAENFLTQKPLDDIRKRSEQPE